MTAKPGSWTAATIRVVAVGITIGVGAAGFALSFTALRDLATRGHVPTGQAWLWPLMVDGAIVLATLGVVVTAGDPRCGGDRRFFWSVLFGGAAVSIACNALHAVLAPDAPLDAWLRGFLAAVAPTALLVTTHGLTLLTRIHGRGAAASIPGPTDTGDPVAPEVSAGDRLHALASTERESATRGTRRTIPAPAAPQAPPGSRWHAVAERVVSRIALKDNGSGDVTEVLYLSFEHTMADREIGRRLGMSHHTVSKIVAAGASALREEDAAALAAQ